MGVSEFCEIIKSVLTSGWSYVVLFIVYIVISKVDAIEKWIEMYHHHKAFHSIRSEKKYIASNTQREVNSAVKQICRDIPEIVPYSLEVKWITDEPKEVLDSLTKEDRIIVKMRNIRNQSGNITNVVQEYVQKGLIPNIRWCLSIETKNVSDLKMTQKILKEGHLDASFEYFQNAVLKTILEENHRVKTCFEKVESLDLRGLFIRIFLYELYKLGMRNLPTSLQLQIILQNETDELLDFLDTFVTRELHKKVNLDFSNSEFNIHIMPIAKKETYQKGLQPYITVFQRLLDQRIKRVYIVGFDPFIGFIEILTYKIERKLKDKVKKIFQINHDAFDREGKNRKAILVLFENKSQT